MKFYVDTSVWGGHEDEEFEEWTIPFFQQARQGRFTIVLSDVTLRELLSAPLEVREMPQSIPEQYLQLVYLTEEQDNLAQQYIKEGALTPKYETDAHHIAVATILKVDSLVSWNFKHMVNFFRINNTIQLILNLATQPLIFRTPKEVTYGDDN